MEVKHEKSAVSTSSHFHSLLLLTHRLKAFRKFQEMNWMGISDNRILIIRMENPNNFFSSQKRVQEFENWSASRKYHLAAILFDTEKTTLMVPHLPRS